MKSIIADAGLTCRSAHFTSVELKDDLGASIAWAHAMDLAQIVISSAGLPGDATLDDWKRGSDEMNAWGKITQENGLPFVYHNHNFEFEKLDGTLIYDVLLEHLDPDVVRMQFQVWVVSIGYNAADYFRAHPGRFVSAHLSDYAGEGTEQTPIGAGVVDWPDFFEAGKLGGLQHIFVEMGSDLLPQSAAYLKGLREP